MPGLDKPQHPRPTRIDIDVDTTIQYSWIDANKQIGVDTNICIYDFADNAFTPTPNGTYDLHGGGQITVLNGVIQ